MRQGATRSHLGYSEKPQSTEWDLCGLYTCLGIKQNTLSYFLLEQIPSEERKFSSSRSRLLRASAHIQVSIVT